MATPMLAGSIVICIAAVAAGAAGAEPDGTSVLDRQNPDLGAVLKLARRAPPLPPATA